MDILRNRQAVFILLLLLSGVMCNAAIIPFMAVYIVQGLGMEPLFISIYTAVTIVLTLFANRLFGEWIDRGTKIAPLVLVSITAFVLANSAILIFQTYWVLVAIASVCFGFSNAAVSTMYSFGRLYAERENLNVHRYNSYLRAMTSIGWMLAPASSFLIAGAFGHATVFGFALGLSCVWGLLWLVAMPKNFSSPPASANTSLGDDKTSNKSLMLAAAACFCFALAHVLCTSALPLFYLQEVGLPSYAPGLSLSTKTFMEIGGILSAPWMISRFGARNSLIAAAMVAMLAFYVLSQVTTLSDLVLGAALEGLYYGVFAGVGITYVQSFARGRMARATSLYMNSLFLGGLVSAASLGLIAQAFDFRTAIMLASVGAVAAAIVLFIMPGKQTTGSNSL